METIEKVILDDRGLQYVQRCIDRGLTFSKLVRNEIELSKGQAFTLAPSNVRAERFYDFESGWLLPPPPKEEWRHIQGGIMVPKRDTRHHLVAEVQRFFASARNPLCLFEDALSQPKDECNLKAKSKMWFYESEVYHLIDQREPTAEIVLDAIREAMWALPIFVGGLISLPDGEKCSVNDREFISQEQLQAFAKHVDHLIVGAYDGE